MSDSILYALDFDGVICDSAIETGMSGWKAAYKIWQDMPESAPPELIEKFRLLRPIIETGYEAILAMRLLFMGESVASLHQGCDKAFQSLMQQAQVDSLYLKRLFGEVRDTWIAEDKADWLSNNPLYPAMADKLTHLVRQNTWFVVTTKQERFVKEILNAENINLAEECIYGLERNMSKSAVLSLLLKLHPGKTIYFVEDRLPTLVKVRQEPDLAGIKLYLALWGYNSAEDKSQAIEYGFAGLELEGFLS